MSSFRQSSVAKRSNQMISQPNNLFCDLPASPNRRTKCRYSKFSLVLVLVLVAALVCITVPPIGRADVGRAAIGNDLNSAMPAGVFDDEYVTGEVLVAFQRGLPRGRIDAIRASVGASVIKELREISVQHWRLTVGLDVARAVQVLSANPDVRYAEPNYIVSADQLPGSPDDAYRSDLWGMHN